MKPIYVVLFCFTLLVATLAYPFAIILSGNTQSSEEHSLCVVQARNWDTVHAIVAKATDGDAASAKPYFDIQGPRPDCNK